MLHEFTLFAFSGFIDALRLAGDKADNSQQREYKWTVIAPTLQPIRSNCGVEVIPWEVFPDPSHFDYLVVIGGRVAPQRNIDPGIIDYLKHVADSGGFIIGVCTATFVLARAGLMQGKRCCVHWYHRLEFEDEFPEIAVNSDTVFIVEKNRITCPGGRSAVDVALYLIEKHCGAASARKAASGMVIEEIRGSYAPQPHAEASWFGGIHNPFIRRAITIMDQSITNQLSMADIARWLRVSDNTLYRIFNQSIGISPAKLFRIIRVAHGHWSLHNTQLSISQIAHIYQFSDASHFIRLHREFYNITPSQARSQGPNSYKLSEETTKSNDITKHILEGGIFIFDKIY